MADPLQPLAPGDPLPLDAEFYNALIAGARAGRVGRAAPPGRRDTGDRDRALPVTPQTTCLVLYDAADTETLPAFSVVTLGAVLTPLTDEGEGLSTSRRPAFTAGVPTGECDQIAVTLEPIQGGSVGRAATTGPAVVRLDVSDAAHARAAPAAGFTSVMISADGGGYPVLYKEAGTGEVYAVVMLGPVAAVGSTVEAGTASAMAAAAPDDEAESGTVATLAAGTWLVTCLLRVGYELVSGGTFGSIELSASLFRRDVGGGGEAGVGLGLQGKGFFIDVVNASKMIAFPVTLAGVVTLDAESEIFAQAKRWTSSSTPLPWATGGYIFGDVLNFHAYRLPSGCGGGGESAPGSGSGSGGGGSPSGDDCTACDLIGNTATMVIPDGPNAGTYTGTWGASGGSSFASVAFLGVPDGRGVGCYCQTDGSALVGFGGTSGTFGAVAAGPPAVFTFAGAWAGSTGAVTVTT